VDDETCNDAVELGGISWVFLTSTVVLPAELQAASMVKTTTHVVHGNVFRNEVKTIIRHFRYSNFLW
jgi:hypothetical protein